MAGPVDVDVTRPSELGEAELRAWRALQRSDRALANPFLAPEFAVAVDHARPGARVAVRRRGTADGFFAYELGRFGLARRIGSRVADMQAVVVPAGDPWDMRELLAAARLRAVRLENMPADRLPAAAAWVLTYPSPVIDLAGGYEAYVASRREVSRSMMSTAMRKKRKLEREVGPVRFEFDSRDHAALRTVMRWKSAQYAQLDEWDRFAAPDVVALVDELFAGRAPGCAGTFSVLYAGDEIAAAHFGLRSEDVLCSWFPSYNPDLGRYSPGLLLHLMMAEGAAARGMSAFDLGRGEHGYKDLLKTHELVLARGAVFRTTPAGLAYGAATAPLDYARVLAARSPRAHTALVAARRALAGRRAAPPSGRADPETLPEEIQNVR